MLGVLNLDKLCGDDDGLYRMCIGTPPQAGIPTSCHLILAIGLQRDGMFWCIPELEQTIDVIVMGKVQEGWMRKARGDRNKVYKAKWFILNNKNACVFSCSENFLRECRIVGMRDIQQPIIPNLSTLLVGVCNHFSR